ncbi:MAG: FAD-dependent oxidoreductase [Desulfobacteraceae bacterium]|nr:FAD-dependent oxidoreductase [Desulfobacteraceae bacterium]
MNSQMKVLVIGGVACGPKTASRLKRLLPESDITLVEKGDLISYGACGIPYYAEGLFSDISELAKTPAGVQRTPAFFDKAKGFKVLTRTEALNIDRQSKTVAVRYLDTGNEDSISYDKLVLATGGYPFHLPVPGADLKNVWFMTHPDDADSLVREIAAQNLKNAVLVGAGFIGIEMAEALVNRGLNVTIAEMEDQIMPGVLDRDTAVFAAKHLTQKGVKLALGEQVTGIRGQGKVESVETKNQIISADLAIIAVGTRPNDKLAREADLKCMDRGGIIVNEYCQTSDKDIYAGGDCVVNNYVDRIVGTPLFVPLGSTANKHGRVIANHIAGKPVPFSGITCTAIVRAFDFTIGRTGISEKQADDLNLDVEITTWSGTDMPHYMPEAKPFIIKMIASSRDRKLLGVQTAGMGNCAKRLDVAASIILMGGTLDQISDIDFGYAPPFSPPIDPIATCAHILTNKLDGIASGISAFEARELVESGGAVLLDVRSRDELETMRMPYDVIHIPLGVLRERTDELPKNKDILAFCKVSLRGYEAQRILNAAGFDRVKFIEGGLLAWPFELL